MAKEKGKPAKPQAKLKRLPSGKVELTVTLPQGRRPSAENLERQLMEVMDTAAYETLRCLVAKEMGRKGGEARAAKHTPEELSEIARRAQAKFAKRKRRDRALKAAAARWTKQKRKKP